MIDKADSKVTLTRRRALAALGGMGVASAGAGLGTSAFFNDAETFDGNAIVAGSLDMKIDWQEHYYGPGDYSQYLTYPLQRDLTDLPGDTLDTDWLGVPSPYDPVVYVYKWDVDRFMRNTAIEAYPDVNDDGVQDPFDHAYSNGVTVGPVCSDGADVPDDLDPTAGKGLRTNAADTYDAATGTVEPLLDLSDVKPGDFGEVTFSLHLCDNPGYVWLQGSLVSNDENTVTEPESGAAGENNDTPSDAPIDGEGELADALRVVFWYDETPGDNVYRTQGERPIVGQNDGVHTSPVSLAEAATYLESGHGVPLDGNVSDTSNDRTDGTTFGELTDAATDGNRDCFSTQPIYYVGFAWWLPRDVGNEVQTDSIGLDLGFYTEQCRHNDGSGAT